MLVLNWWCLVNLRSSISLQQFCDATSITMDSIGMHNFHNMLSTAEHKDDLTGAYRTRFQLRYVVWCVDKYVDFSIALMFHDSHYHGWGLQAYLTKFPEGAAFDLNQNIQRGKKAYDVMFTLTTGCSHVWLVKPARYLTGTEELLMHSVPISKEAADIMKATQVVMKGQSHSSQCFMAGNSMHGANVGTCIAYALLFTRST